MKTTAMLIDDMVRIITGEDSIDHLLNRLSKVDTPEVAAATEKINGIANGMSEILVDGPDGTYIGPNPLPLADALRTAADLMAETTFIRYEEQLAAEARLRR